MAKASRSKKNNKTAYDTVEIDMLPQNIISIGEHVEEGKNIYISQPAYNVIRKFTQGKTTNESGGILVGNVIEEFGKINIIISGFVEAKFSEATATTLKFTHETWEFVHKEVDKKYPRGKIVGWIHTHPNFGIFLSEYDKFIHGNFFKEEYQVAYVIDPIQNIEGFYFWITGNIERCKGFYIYDKTGVKISIDKDSDEEKDDPEEQLFTFNNIALLIMVICLVITTFTCVKLKGQIIKLENQQHNLAEATQVAITSLQSQIDNLSQQPSAQEAPDTSVQSAGIPAPSDGNDEAGSPNSNADNNSPASSESGGNTNE